MCAYRGVCLGFFLAGTSHKLVVGREEKGRGPARRDSGVEEILNCTEERTK